MTCYRNRCNKGCSSLASNRSNPNHHRRDERGKTPTLHYWHWTLNLADPQCMSSNARPRTSWRETECTRWGLRVLIDILQAAVEIRLDACSPMMWGTASVTTMRGSDEEAARQQGLLHRCSCRRWKRNRPAVWERRVRGRVRGEREIGEVGRWGELWRVRRNDVAYRAPSPDVQAKPRVAPPEAGPVETLKSVVSPGLCGRCFNARADQENEGAQESNQRPLGSPEPCWTLHMLPMVPINIGTTAQQTYIRVISKKKGVPAIPMVNLNSCMIAETIERVHAVYCLVGSMPYIIIPKTWKREQHFSGGDLLYIGTNEVFLK
jgi:hypothetical protein